MATKKLNIYQTDRLGTVMIGDKSFPILPHTRHGKIIAPATEEEDRMLQNSPGFNTGWWIIDPDALGPEGNDLRLYKVLTPEKLDRLFALPDNEQTRIMNMLNDNFESLVSEGINTGAPVNSGKITPPEGSEGKPDKKGTGKQHPDKQNTGKQDANESGDDSGDEGLKAVPFEAISVKELHDILSGAGVEYDPKAKKEELYKLVFPDAPTPGAK